MIVRNSCFSSPLSSVSWCTLNLTGSQWSLNTLNDRPTPGTQTPEGPELKPQCVTETSTCCPSPLSCKPAVLPETPSCSQIQTSRCACSSDYLPAAGNCPDVPWEKQPVVEATQTRPEEDPEGREREAACLLVVPLSFRAKCLWSHDLGLSLSLQRSGHWQEIRMVVTALLVISFMLVQYL